MAIREKTGGRTKGTPNKTTGETKELLLQVLGKEVTKLGSILAKLEPMERVIALSKLLPYILPKQQESSIEIKTVLTEEQRDARINELKHKFFKNEELKDEYK